MSAAPAAARLWQWGESIESLNHLLDRGGILAVPTESSYGLAVDPRHAGAVEAVCRIKKRQRDKPLPVVAADVRRLSELGIVWSSEEARSLAGEWPAPLTLVLPVSQVLAASAGTGTLAVRVPAHRLLQELLSVLDRPLTATSANPGRQAPFLDPREVAEWLDSENVDALVVGGERLAGGPPSTIVDLTRGRGRLLRRGGYSLDRLRLQLDLDERPG